MNKLNDLILYGNGLYEIERETDTQYCLHERYSLAESRLIAGWVNKNAIGISDRIPGDNLTCIQLAMTQIFEKCAEYDPID
jgi:hypothetical protein